MKLENRIKVGRGLRQIFIIILVLMLNSISFGQYNNEFNSDENVTGMRFINFSGITAATGNHGSAYGIKFINGALLDNRFGMGFGLGYDKYSKSSVIPLYLDLRFFPDFQGDEGAFFSRILGILWIPRTY